MGVFDLIQKQFHLPDQKLPTFMNEIYGGLVMYLATVNILTKVPVWQAGACPDCMEGLNVTSPAGYTAEQLRALPGAVALAAGISTIVMGFAGNMPIMVAQGLKQSHSKY